MLFVEPDTTALGRVREAGADGIEIYTGSYAAAFRAGRHSVLLDACTETAKQAKAHGLVVNAGHDLSLHNLPPLICADSVPG